MPLFHDAKLLKCQEQGYKKLCIAYQICCFARFLMSYALFLSDNG